MAEAPDDDLQAVLRPLASLVSKSEKAQTKLRPDTWQHAMLRDNIAALRLATDLLSGPTSDSSGVSHDDLRAAVRAVEDMIERTAGAAAKFAPGTSQHTLACNRLRALRAARAALHVRLSDA